MADLTSLDGSFEKTLAGSNAIKDLPSIIQKYMMAGVSNNKLTFTKLFDEEAVIDNGGLVNVVAQLAMLDEKQQSAFLSLSKLDEKVKDTIKDLLQATKQGELFNSKLFEQEASKDNKLSKGVLNEVMQAAGMKDTDGNYLLTNTKDVCDLLEQYANDANNAQKAQELFNAGLLEQSDNGYKVSASLLKLIDAKKSDIVTTGIAAAGQMAWNYAMQIGKQLLLSLGVAAVAFIATKIVDYLMNLKTHSEELVATMNDSHEAAQQATKDVEEIQSKIDDLNKSLKDAGVDKIEDIVDPAERERLQAINDMLQAQLKLKKQLEKDANNKANADTSTVVNDKTENSIVKTRTVNVSYAEGGANAGTHQVAEKVSKTESLQEYTAALEDNVQKRRDLQVELDQIEASSGKDSKEYADKKKELDALNDTFKSQKTTVEELSSAVSEQMNNYSTDADNFAQYKDEYVAGTNAITDATKALADANDDVKISTTAYDILLQKMQATKNLSSTPYASAVKTLKASGLETGDDIRELSAVPANQTKAQAEAIKVLDNAAKDAGVTLDQFVSVLETVGLVTVRDSSKVKSLSDAMTALDNMQSAYQSCAQAVKEYNKTGYVTMDTLQSLCQLEPQYLNMLDLKNGKLKINTETANTLTQANIKLAKAALLADTLNNIKDTNTLKKAKAILGDVTAVISDADTALTAASQKSSNEAKDSGGWEAYDYVSRANSMQIKNYHTLSGLLDDLSKQDPSKIWGKDDTSKSTKQATSAIDAWSTLSSAMKEFNQQGYITLQTLKSLSDLEDRYVALLTKNDVTGQLEIQTDAFYNLTKAELKAAQAKGDGVSELEYNKILEWTDRNIKKQTMSYWDLVAAIEGYSAALSGAKDITDTFKDAWSNGKTVKEKQEKSRAGALDYEGTEAQSSALQDLMKYSKYDPELIGKAFNKETGKIDLSGDMLKNAVVESLKQQAAAARTEGGAAAEAIAASYEKSAENIKNDVISVQDYFDGLGSTIEEVSSKIDELQSAFTDLDDIKTEYDTYGGLSVDSLQKLLTMSPDYIACLEMEGDQLIFNRDKMVELLIAQLESKKEFLLSKEETKDQAEIIQKIIDALRKDGVKALAGMNYQAEKLKSALSDAKDVLSSFLSLLSGLNDKSNNDLKLWGEAMTEDIDKRIDALNKQKEALEKANDEEERAITLAKLKAELEKARTQRTVRKYTSNGYEWVADASAVKEAQDNLNDQQRTWRKEDAEKAIDDQIDKLNELKDKYSEIINLIGTSWDDYNKKLKYSAEIADMTFTEMEGRLDVFKGNVLGAMQSTKATSGIQDVISKLESLITTLEKINNLYSWAESGFTDYTDKGFNGLIKTVKKIFGSTGSDGKLNISISTGLKNIGQTVKNAFSGTSGNSITKAFQAGWEAISSGAKGLFSGSGANSLTTIFSNGLSGISDFIGSAFKGLGSTFASGGRTLVKAAGSVAASGATAAGGGIAIAGASAIPVIGAIVAGVVNGINTNIRLIKNQKEIWSGNDKIGTKIVKSVGNIVWRYSPIGMIASTIQNISGFVKKIFGIESKKDKNNGTSSNGKIDVGSIVINSPDSPASNANSGTSGSDTGTTKQSLWDRIKNSKLWFWNWGKRAVGDKGVKHSGMYNVDEQGPELLVRQPASGRYTYLETGDGVVPADITSKLFEMGGNTDKWFADQLSKNGALNNIQNKTIGDTISVGDIYIQNPVGDTDALAREIVRDLPIKLRQQQGRR